MVLAVSDRVEFYTSSNLKVWSFASGFSSDIPGIHRGIFECPDVFEIQVDENPNTTKWILTLIVGDRNGVNPNDSEPPAGGSGMSSSSNQETAIGYNVLNEELFVDRTKSNAVDFHPDFAPKHKAPIKPEHERIQLSIYVDWSSVEDWAKWTFTHFRRV